MPDQISTAAELDALPTGSVFEELNGHCVWRTYAPGEHQAGGHGRPMPSERVASDFGPFALLYRPDTPVILGQNPGKPTVAQIKAEALREAATELDRDAAEGRAARRVAAARCTWCGLRHEEREEYSCQIEGTAHNYDDAELAEAAQLDGETSWIGDRLRARAAAIESGAEHG